MNSIAEIVEFRRYSCIGFYTIKSEDKSLSEAEDFFERMSQIPEIADQLERLIYWLERVGEGDIEFCDAFREEGICLALPPKTKVTQEVIELRLYCYAVTENVVILFNGDLKTDVPRAQQCPNVKHHLQRAINWASKLKNESIETRYTKITNCSDINITY